MSQKVLVFPFKSVFPDNWHKVEAKKAQTFRAANEISALSDKGFKIYFVGECADKEVIEKYLGTDFLAYIQKHIHPTFDCLFENEQLKSVARRDITVFYNPPGSGPLPEYHTFIRWLLVPLDMVKYQEERGLLTELKRKQQNEGLGLINYKDTLGLGITPKLGHLLSSQVEQLQMVSFTPCYQLQQSNYLSRSQCHAEESFASAHRSKYIKVS